MIICIPFRSQRIPLKASNISDKLNKEKNRREKKEKSKWQFYWLSVDLLCKKLQIFPTHQNVHFSLRHLNRHTKLIVPEEKRMKKKMKKVQAKALQKETYNEWMHSSCRHILSIQTQIKMLTLWIYFVRFGRQQSREIARKVVLICPFPLHQPSQHTQSCYKEWKML